MNAQMYIEEIFMKINERLNVEKSKAQRYIKMYPSDVKGPKVLQTLEHLIDYAKAAKDSGIVPIQLMAVASIMIILERSDAGLDMLACAACDILNELGASDAFIPPTSMTRQ